MRLCPPLRVSCQPRCFLFSLAVGAGGGCNHLFSASGDFYGLHRAVALIYCDGADTGQRRETVDDPAKERVLRS
jgi:hypothetical protein